MKLKALPPAALVARLKDYVEWDLGNLARLIQTEPLGMLTEKCNDVRR